MTTRWMDDPPPRGGSGIPDLKGALRASLVEVIGERHLDQALPGQLGSGGSDRGSWASFESLRHVQEALEHAYGLRGGQGLTLRSGRNFFHHAVRRYGSSLGLTEDSLLFKAAGQRMAVALQAMAELFQRITGNPVVLEHDRAGYTWRVRQCPFCAGRHANAPICHFTIGLLQEASYWASGGKIYPVEEQRCLACGDPECLIAIAREPLS